MRPVTNSSVFSVTLQFSNQMNWSQLHGYPGGRKYKKEHACIFLWGGEEEREDFSFSLWNRLLYKPNK